MRIAQEAIDRHAAHGHGDQKAITWLGKKGERIELTYSTLDSLSNQFANLLAKLGVEPGDRVYSLVSPNSLRYFRRAFGRSRASRIPIQARTRDPKTEMTSSRDVEALPLHRSSAGRRVGTLGKPRAVSILA